VATGLRPLSSSCSTDHSRQGAILRIQTAVHSINSTSSSWKTTARHAGTAAAGMDAYTRAGTIAEKKQPRFSSNASMPALCECLRKAAYDPRVAGLFIQVDPVAIGWAKVQELVAHIDFFRKSGKPTVAFMKSGGEKEYVLAAACEEIYIPPTAQLALRGLSVQGAFLRGVLDKVGVEPQVWCT
jgi:Peptidase family S49